ncbi:MAG: AIR synthase-related protein [Bilifractor sp.]
MRTGKISEAVLKRSVLKLIKNSHPGHIEGPDAGKDAAVVRPGTADTACVIAASVSPDIEASLPVRVMLAVQTAVNNLATEGATPVGIELHILLPDEAEEQELKTIMKAAEDITEKLAIVILGGHTTVCPSVRHSLITVTALGELTAESSRSCKISDISDMLSGGSPDHSCSDYAGKELVVTKSVGMAAVMLLAGEKEQELSEQFTQDITEVPMHFLDDLSVLPEAGIACQDSGTLLMHDLSEGGIFGGLWEMAQRAGTGLDIQVRQIPIRQETVEISEFFDMNPYQSLSQGSLLILTENGEELVQKLTQAGIAATVIGRTTRDNARILRNRDEIRYLDKPQQDGIYAVL